MIAIEDMDKLPENCHVCPFSYQALTQYWGKPIYVDEPYVNWCSWHNCTTDGSNGGDKKRMRGCPLKEVEV